MSTPPPSTLGQKTYDLTGTINTATTYGQMNASITITKSDVFTEKSGLQNGDIVNWNVVINPNPSDVENATLTDRLSTYQQPRGKTPTTGGLYVQEYLVTIFVTFSLGVLLIMVGISLQGRKRKRQ